MTISQLSRAQTVAIANIEFAQNQVHLTYNFLDSVVGRYYTIRLYSSEDNFLNPMEEVSAEVRMEIKPGMNKILTWKASK